MTVDVTHAYSANGGEGRRVLATQVQGTEGTAATLDAAADVKLYDAGSRLTPKRESLSPSVVSPEQPGTITYSTGEHVMVDLTSRIFPRTITSANSADRPDPHDLFVASGAELISDATDKAHTYVWGSNQGDVLTAWEYRLNANNTKNQLLEAFDVRGNLQISGTYGKELVASFSGLGKNVDESAIRTLDENPYAAAVNSFPAAARLPLLLKGATILVYDQVGTTLYGGGSLSTPGSAGDLRAFTWNANRGTAARGGASASSGIHGAMHNHGRQTLQLKLEVNDIRLHAWQAATKALQVRIRIPQPGASGNTCTILAYGTITNVVDNEIEDNLYIATVDLALAYPIDHADGNPAIGANPFQRFTTTTNQGVPLMPSSPAVIPYGVFLMQFATA